MEDVVSNKTAQDISLAVALTVRETVDEKLTTLILFFEVVLYLTNS